MLFESDLKLRFYPEELSCQQCGKRLHVLKTQTRTVVTLGTGPFIAHETSLVCPDDGDVYRSADLQRLVPYKGTFGYDILVYVGTSLMIRSMNEQVVKKELALQAIDISVGEIRFLAQKFVAYLDICHRQSLLKLRLKLARNGGYILHIDGTCEGDSPHLFTGMDEISGIILSSVKINSEKQERIVPFLEDIRVTYGTPLSVISDMGKGLLGAIDEVFPTVPSLICHFHFLRDIGKDLLDADYRILRNGLMRSRIRTALKNKVKDFEKKLGQTVKDLVKVDADLALASIKTTLLVIHWMFDTSSLSGYGFPFDMKHYVFYQRLISGYATIKSLLDQTGSKPFYQLIKLLDRIIEDQDLKRAALRLKKYEKIFGELREALRIALPDGEQGLNDNGGDEEMKSIAERVALFIEKYDSTEDPSLQKMIEQIQKYDNRLFADPIPVTVDGGIIEIQPQRTNNIMERFFRHLKRLLRSRSGSISVKRSLSAMLPGTVLTKNLEDETYLELLLNGASTLEERFAQIDSQLLLKEFTNMKSSTKKIPADARKLIREEHSLDKIEKMYLATAS